MKRCTSYLKCKLDYAFSDSLFKNSFHLISSTFASSGLGFLFWMVVARFYASDEVGLAAGVISSMHLLALFSFLGFNISLIRFLPQSEKKEDIINSCFSSSLIVALIISFIFIAGINFWSPKMVFLKDNYLYSFIFIIFIGIWVVTVLMDSVFIACRTSKYVLLKEFIFSSTKVPLPIVFSQISAFGVFLSWIIGALISLAYGFKILRRIFPAYRPKFVLKRDILKEMFHFSFLNYMANFFNVMPGLILPIMVANLISPREAAYFYTAWSISTLLSMIPRQISQSLFAEGSNFKDSLNTHIYRSIRIASLILIPSIIFILIFGDKLLLIYGPEYTEGGLDLLRIFAISSVPLAICSIYSTIKNIESNVKIVLLINATIALITLAVSYFFIGSTGLIGVGYAWLAANSIAAIGIGLKILTIYLGKSQARRDRCSN